VSVTQADAEVLRAMGFRAESTLLDGPRVVLDCDDVYITLVPGPEREIHWAVWAQGSGQFHAGGQHANPVTAAHEALAWIQDEWR
jgi:hypothetical protein